MRSWVTPVWLLVCVAVVSARSVVNVEDILSLLRDRHAPQSAHADTATGGRANNGLEVFAGAHSSRGPHQRGGNTDADSNQGDDVVRNLMKLINNHKQHGDTTRNTQGREFKGQSGETDGGSGLPGAGYGGIYLGPYLHHGVVGKEAEGGDDRGGSGLPGAGYGGIYLGPYLHHGAVGKDDEGGDDRGGSGLPGAGYGGIYLGPYLHHGAVGKDDEGGDDRGGSGLPGAGYGGIYLGPYLHYGAVGKDDEEGDDRGGSGLPGAGYGAIYLGPYRGGSALLKEDDSVTKDGGSGLPGAGCGGIYLGPYLHYAAAGKDDEEGDDRRGSGLPGAGYGAIYLGPYRGDSALLEKDDKASFTKDGRSGFLRALVNKDKGRGHVGHHGGQREAVQAVGDIAKGGKTSGWHQKAANGERVPVEIAASSDTVTAGEATRSAVRKLIQMLRGLIASE